MFKKIAIVAAASLALVTSACAQGYHRGGHYHGGYGSGWVGPVVGGAIIGGVIGSLAAPRYYAAPPIYVSPPVYAPSCYNRFLGHDAYSRPVYDRICR